MPVNPTCYLPSNYRGEAIGLIAGKGRYPVLTAERIRQAGLPLRVISFQGETDTDFIASLAPNEHISIKVGQLGKLLKALNSLDCTYAIMAGQITPKKLFHGLHPDLKALRILNGLKTKNAETIFGAIANEIEATGVKMLDARAFLDDQMAESGLMTKLRMKVSKEHLDHGVEITKAIAGLDIGQGAVVRKGTVLAIEAYEGTDRMLLRAGEFKTDNLIFIKTAKRNQDYRFDVPVFGSYTLETMHRAGIHTAALETNSVIILDKEKLIREADLLKICLTGFSAE